MGGHYGSIQVRTLDRAAVLAAAEAVAAAKKIRCLVGPELAGWVGIYPENNGQDDSVGQAIADRLDADVLHLLVHDDDVLAYWLWRKHQLVDSYWSKPGMLGDENLAEEEKRCGDAEQFRAIIGDKVERLAKVLDRAVEYTFEGERLGKLANVLGMSNAVTEYDYLVSDERSGIKGLRKFTKIPPDPEIEKVKIPSVKLLRAKLQKSGVLIYFDQRDEFATLAVGCTSGDGFILGWSNHVHHTNELVQLSPPWDNPGIRSFEAPSFIQSLKFDGNSDLVLVTTGTPAIVMNASTGIWTPLLEINDPNRVFGSAVSKSGNVVACAIAQYIVAIELSTGKRLGTFGWRNPSTMAIHPSGKWMVVSGDALGIIHLDADPKMRITYVGGTRSFVVGNAWVIEQPGCVGFSRDGRFFWCGTNVGLRIYEWEALSSQSNRKSRWLLRLRDTLPSFVDKQVTAIAQESDGAGIVFGTFAGKLARFCLQTGELYKLADLPGGGEVQQLMFSADGTMLAVGSDKETRKGPRSMPKHAQAWEIWDYRKLRDSGVFLSRAEKKLPAPSTEDASEDLSQWRRGFASGRKTGDGHRRIPRK
jgi:WD40 repeat protein